MTGASMRCVGLGRSAVALALAGLGAALAGPAGAGEMSFTVTIEQLTTEQTCSSPARAAPG